MYFMFAHSPPPADLELNKLTEKTESRPWDNIWTVSSATLTCSSSLFFA
jgi:hypothetical protein